LRLDEGISALAPTRVPTVPLADPTPAPGQVVAQAALLPAPGQVEVRPRIAPISKQRFALQVTIEGSTYDKLRHAQDLLSHAGDVAAVLDRALDALIGQLEKRRFAATAKPRKARPAGRKRTIPARVKRAVWQRDGGRCTFVGANEHRCEERKYLEFDHVVPVALGGEATVEQVRLLCRTHNQLAAEKAFGRDFMEAKRNGTRVESKERGAMIVRDGPHGPYFIHAAWEVASYVVMRVKT
jgi:5-methylcytosine-specific restriction endonuclease McrA